MIVGRENGLRTALANVGCARASTLDQNLSLQFDTLAAAGCDKIFLVHASGVHADRTGLALGQAAGSERAVDV